MKLKRHGYGSGYLKMVKYSLIIFAALFLVSTRSQAVYGQWYFHGSAYTAYDSNPLGLNGTESSQITNVEVGADHTRRFFDIHYSGRYTAYSRLSSFDHFWHQAYVAVGSDTTALFIQAEQRLPTRDNTYGYGRLGAVAMHRFALAGVSMMLQGRGQYMRFAELIQRNQWSLNALIRANRSFQTGSTIIAEVGSGYTAYPNLKSQLLTARGQEAPWIVQLNWGLRFAQSLTPTTGVALQYRQQVLDASSLSPFVASYYASYAVLDDPSLYASRTLGIEFTQMLFQYALMLKAGAYGIYRNYVAQGSYTGSDTYDASIEREDSYGTLWFRAEWGFLPPWLNGHKLKLLFGTRWTVNDSNSYWYDYDNQYATLGVGYEY